MNGSYLLDSNAAIRILNGQVALKGRNNDESLIFLCLTVIGELYFGAAKSAQPEPNRQRIQRLIEACMLLPHDLATAERYGSLKASLQKQGRPIPENDLWIAAAALRHGAVLVTGDHHFDNVEGLRVEAW